jgi:hypothetical protein
MNETEFLDRFKEFEDVEVTDTYTTQIINQARELEDFMNNTPYGELSELDRLDLKLFVNEKLAVMNQECPYLDQQVIVSGAVVTASHDLETDSFAIIPVVHGEHEVIAKGFKTLLIESPLGSGNFRYNIGHYFLSETLEARQTQVALVENIPQIYSFAPVGSVDIVADIPERRRADVLYKTIPNIIESVNFEIGQAENEVDALCRLRYVTVEDAGAIPEDTINDLMMYTYESLGLDEVVPYVVQLRGAVYQGKLGARGGIAFDHYDNTASPLLVLPIELRLAQYPQKVNGGFELGDSEHFMIKLRIVGDQNGAADRTIFAPIRNIKSLRSLREHANDSKNEKWQRA